MANNKALDDFMYLRRNFRLWLRKYQTEITEPKLVRDFGVILDLLEKYEELLEEALE